MTTQINQVTSAPTVADLRSLIVNKSSELKDLVTFGYNKFHAKHRWYPFVEGFSSEFVRRIIGQQEYPVKICYDPFGGVGTTALTCQELNIKCISAEANPFIADIAEAKLGKFDLSNFETDLVLFQDYLSTQIGTIDRPEFESKTFFESDSQNKWLFHTEAADGLLDIKCGISTILFNDLQNIILFKLAYASIIVNVSNVFRNGKCLSYRKNWEDRKFSRKEIHNLFIEHCTNIILVDLRTSSLKENKVKNLKHLHKGDSRELVKLIKDNTIDLVVTSPPYLNSRDYTDIYRLELWMLGYVSTFASEQLVRRAALTSHVQYKLPKFESPQSEILNSYLFSIKDFKAWNPNISNMIKGYFHDMNDFLLNLFGKLTKHATVYINVSNSCYFSLECEVDLIIAELAVIIGYSVKEIQVARNIRTSSQQKGSLKVMRESVIVLKKSLP